MKKLTLTIQLKLQSVRSLNIIKIKVSIKGAPSKINISQFIENNFNSLNNCRFYINDVDCTEADFWFIIDDLEMYDNSCFVAKNNIYYFTGEHAYPLNFFASGHTQRFLQQFAQIFTPLDIYLNNVRSTLPFLPWMINSNHGNNILLPHNRDKKFLLTNNLIKKNKLMSVICSNKTITPEHKLRLRFVKHLKTCFGDSLDWFGNGVNSVAEKWHAIYPYKYHIVLENRSAHNIISEKLHDSFLGMAYPIYWGAPNVHEYFPEQSVTSINILDLNGAVSKIIEIIKSQTYRKNYRDLILAKNLVLNKYNLFNRLSEIASSNYIIHSKATRRIMLYPLIRSKTSRLKYILRLN